MKKITVVASIVMIAFLEACYLPDVGNTFAVFATRTPTPTNTSVPTSTPSSTPTITVSPTATITPTPKPLDAIIHSENGYLLGDTLHFIGLVRNTGKKPFTIIRVITEFKENDQVVHTGYGHSSIIVVWPGQSVPFEIVDRLPLHWDEIDEYSSTVEIKEYTGTKHYDGLIIKDDKSKIKATGSHEISGHLFNNGDSVAGFPKVAVVYYDEDGVILATHFTTVPSVIYAGDQQEFRLLFPGVVEDVEKISRYEFYVESTNMGLDTAKDE
jgi:hypothetical protein